MKWDDVSDFEINKAVADAKGLFWHCKPSSLQNDGYTWIYSDNYCDCDTSNGSFAVELPDYCNSWADMGPVISDNSIDLEWPEYELGGVGQASKYIQGGMDIQIEFRDKRKALRAAAIVYLMMNGVKPEGLINVAI